MRKQDVHLLVFGSLSAEVGAAFLAAAVPVAADCGDTAWLARDGLLDNRTPQRE